MNGPVATDVAVMNMVKNAAQTIDPHKIEIAMERCLVVDLDKRMCSADMLVAAHNATQPVSDDTHGA